MNTKKVLLTILLVTILIAILIFLGITAKKNKKDSEKLSVVVTNFAAYDFVRQIAGDNVELTFILNPGVEAHSYDPTVKDIITIQESDLFIYIGGEVEQWSDKIIETMDKSNTRTVCLLDTVNLIEEEHIDGAEEHKEEEGITYDEHIWTSPSNAIKIVKYLKNVLCDLDSANKSIYEQNANNYIEKIENLRNEIQQIVDNKVRDRLVFGDKMPMQYFLNEFSLEASAAFNGCSTEAEPSSSTIAYLIEKVKTEEIPVVLYIELSNGAIAKTIADEAGCEMMQIQSLHNVSKQDFENGETYVSLMTRNLEVLKKALQ